MTRTEPAAGASASLAAPAVETEGLTKMYPGQILAVADRSVGRRFDATLARCRDAT